MKKSAQKYMALVLTGAMMLGGCGTDGKKQIQQAESETVQSEQGGMPASESIVEDASESSEENQNPENITAAAVPTISITKERKEWYSEDGDTLLLEAEASRVEVISNGFDALKGTLEKQWDGLQDNYDEELGWAKEQYNALDKTEKTYFTPCTFTREVNLYRNDGNVISFCESFYEYSGGAHGMYGVEGRTFDVKSGRELLLEDILSDSAGFYDKATDYIVQKLDEEYGEELFPEYRETVEMETFGETPVSWYLDDEGIVIDYDLYMIAPYVAGAPSVTLPYDDFTSYIKDEYMKSDDSATAGILTEGVSGNGHFETAPCAGEFTYGL